MPRDEATSLFPETAPLMVSACQATRFPLHSTGNLHLALSPATGSTYCGANMGKAHLSWCVAGGCWCWERAREAEGLVEGQMPTCPHTSPDTCLPAWGHKATPHTSPNTSLPAQGCEVAPKTPFTTCHTGDAASGAAAPGRRLRCLRETKLPQHESETQRSRKEQLWKTPAAPSFMSLYILSVTYRKQNGLAELSEGVTL